jgi:pantetheine-phosphate adenylyltransferase
MRKAVYAGSFDPITLGHVWIIQSAAPLFEELVVAIGVNPAKKATFSVEQRLAFLKEATAGIANCSCTCFENKYLVDYAAEVQAQTIIRGIRNEADFTYERTMRHVNSDLRPEILTLFLMPPRAIAELSSSMVKGMVGPAGWEQVVRRSVPGCVFEALRALHGASQGTARGASPGAAHV